MDAHILHFFNCLGTILFDSICNSNNTKKFTITGKIQRSFSFFGKMLWHYIYLISHLNLFTDIFITATIQSAAIKHSLNPISWQYTEILNLYCRHPFLFCTLGNCSCQWMFAFFLQCISDCQKLCLTPAVYRNHIRNLRFSLCNRSGFIQCHNLCFSGFLQRYSRLKENTVFCAHSVADHDGNRCSKTKCTRTTNN